MKALVHDLDSLRSLRPGDVSAFLRARVGWQEARVLPTRGAIWTKEATEDDPTARELLIPLDPLAPSYAQRMSEILSILEESEKRPELEVLEDLSLAGADVIRPRLPGISSEGTISLESGMIAYEQARDMMLAAACAAVEPREVYAKRKSEQAMKYLHHAQFGIPKRGSYVLTIISPVAPRLRIKDDFFEDETEPFERRTVRVLSEALSTLGRVCRDVAMTQDFSPIKEAVRQGVSANLCDAIVALHECGECRGLEVSFSWAPSRGAPRSATDRVIFSPDMMPIVQEAARLFRDTAPQEGVEVIGSVFKLERQTDIRGKVTIYGSVEGVPRTVVTELADAEHSLAVRAYEDRIPLSCSGELVREGRSWVLKQPRSVRLLSHDSTTD